MSGPRTAARTRSARPTWFRPSRGAGVVEARLLPDRALLRAAPAGAADHALAPARPGGVELCDLEDRRRVVRRVELARLDLVPARQRLRGTQPERPAADVLPAARPTGKPVLRHGHAPRLRLRRRPDRPGREGDRRSGQLGVYHVSSGSDFSIKELFDATVAAIGHRARRSRVEVRPRTPTMRFIDPARPQPQTRRTSAGRRRPLSRRASQRAIAYYRDYGITETYTHLKHRGGRSSRRSERPGCRRSSSSAAPASSAATSCAQALDAGAARMLVVDNLLSASARTFPTTPRVEFVEASIADDAVLASLDDEFDYVFHLATYHGNQSSIADPLADHDNNLITTLKLYERLKGFKRLRKVVYSASGCTLAPHDVYDEAEADDRGRPGAARPRQPVPDLEGGGRVLLRLLPPPAGLPTVRARFQNVYGPGEILGAGDGAARRRPSGATSRRPSSTARSRACRSRLDNEGMRHPRLHLCRRHRARACSSARARAAGRRLQPRQRRGDQHPRAGRADRPCAEPTASPARARAARGLGSLGDAIRQHREGGARDRLSGRRHARGRPAPHDRLDARSAAAHRRCIAKHADRLSEPAVV